MIFKNILFYCLIFCGLKAHALKVEMVSDIWCPFHCDAKKADSPGVLVLLAKGIFGSNNISYENTNDFKAAIKLVEKGEKDLLVGALKSNSTRSLLFPKVPQIRTSKYIFLSKSYIRKKFKNTLELKKTIKSWKDLEKIDFKIGYVRGYTYSANSLRFLKSLDSNQKMELIYSEFPVKDFSVLIRKGKLNSFIEGIEVVQNYYKGKNRRSWNVYPLAKVSVNDVFIAVSPKHPKKDIILKMLEVGTQKIKKNKFLWNQILEGHNILGN